MLTRTVAGVRRLVRGARLTRREAHRLVQAGYRVTLRRSPDPGDLAGFSEALRTGRLSPAEFLLRLWAVAEGDAARRSPDHGTALQAARELMARQLPRAAAILDLSGELLGLGYPYPCRNITVLAPGRNAGQFDPTRTEVRYRPVSEMLAAAEAGSVGLAFVGDTFGRLTPDDLAEVRRVLGPTGSFCVDVPNAAVARIERGRATGYMVEELATRLQAAGFAVAEVKGIGWVPEAVRTGRFDPAELIRHAAVYADAGNCYRLFVRCRRRE